MQRVGKQVGNFICTHNDGDRTIAKRAEEGASDVRGLWARDDGGITGFPLHETAQEGKGESMDMDGCNHGGGEERKTYRMEFPKGGAKNCPVEGCLGREGTRTAMRVHFWRRHVRDTVIILEEGNLPHRQ